LALFRPVNGNVLGAIWFTIVAGKPHLSSTLFCVMAENSTNWRSYRH
jgi:hypothetical protein